MSVYSAAELGELATNLGAIEDWLRDKCESRHNDDMADVIGKALTVIEDLYDEQYEAEHKRSDAVYRMADRSPLAIP